MKFGICEWNIPHPETALRFEWAAETGLQGLEIDLENAAGNEARFRDLSNQWKLQVPSFEESFIKSAGGQTVGIHVAQTAEEAVSAAIKLAAV